MGDRRWIRKKEHRTAVPHTSNHQKTHSQLEPRSFGTETNVDLISSKIDPTTKALAAFNFAEIGIIQPKLTLGQPNDHYEQEADRVASVVVQRLENEPSHPTTQPAEIRHSVLPLSPIMRLPIQRDGIASDPVGDSFELQLNQSRSGGIPLEPKLRGQMESTMGADFSSVKIHTNAQSDQLSRSIQARAFTSGRDIFFKQGEYNPSSRSGQELLAHELTHVVQQNGGSATVSRSIIQANRTRSNAVTEPPNLNVVDPAEVIEGLFSALSNGIGPEDMRRLLEPIHDRLPQIIDQHFHNPYYSSGKPTSLLAYAAYRNNRVENIEFLINMYGADVNAPGAENDRTALHFAAAGKQIENIEALFAQGADPWILDAAGWTAYDVAVANGAKEIQACLSEAMMAMQVQPIFGEPQQELDDPRQLALEEGEDYSTPEILAAATKSMDPSMDHNAILAMYEQLYRYSYFRPILDIAALEARASRRDDPNALRIFLSDTETTLPLRPAYPYGSYNDLDVAGPSGVTQKREGTVTVGGQRAATTAGGIEVADGTTTMLATLIHELTHHAANKIFGNNTIPIEKGDVDTLELYLAAYHTDASRFLDDTMAPKTSEARRIGFEEVEHGYAKASLKLQEIIVRVPQSMMMFGEVAKEALPAQFQFFNKHFIPQAKAWIQNHEQIAHLNNDNMETGSLSELGDSERIQLQTLTGQQIATSAMQALKGRGEHTYNGLKSDVAEKLMTAEDNELIVSGFEDHGDAFRQQGASLTADIVDERSGETLKEAIISIWNKAANKGRLNNKSSSIAKFDSFMFALAETVQLPRKKIKKAVQNILEELITTATQG